MLSSLLLLLSNLLTIYSQTTLPPTTIPATLPPTTPPVFQGPAQCLLTLPPNPLTATGLSTPFQLQGLQPNQPCTMANQQTTTFVEAVIFDPTTYNLYVYHPLVIDAGTTPFITPILPQIPNNAIIALFFGTNGISLTLQPLLTLQQANCINGISTNDIFGQFAYCNAISFYNAVHQAIQNNNPIHPTPPPLGKDLNGDDCPTTRSFFIVDQDPSDNLVTTYLLDPATNKVFQDIPNNRLQYPNAIILKNGSDNRLLTVLNTALGCTSYSVPALHDPSGILKLPSLATNEIHASLFQNNPVALIPKGDPMTRVLTANGPIPSLVKINSYRKGVNQPQITDINQASTSYFCVHMLEQLPRLQNNKALFTTQLSPDPAAANSLFTFLANRFSQSYFNLKCDAILDVLNPVTIFTQNNIVIDATFGIVDKIQLDHPDPYLLPITPEPTTPSPTTPEPTTPSPTTPEPTTLIPTTLQPTSPIPTTNYPTTSVPTTLSPTTLYPTTHSPTTQSPTISPAAHSPTPESSTNTMDSKLSFNTIVYIIGLSIVLGLGGGYLIYRKCFTKTNSSPDDGKIPILLKSEDDSELGLKRSSSPSPSSNKNNIHLPRIMKSLRSSSRENKHKN
jgi:hypothetical protein